MRRPVKMLGALLVSAWVTTVVAAPRTSAEPAAEPVVVKQAVPAGPHQGFARVEPEADTFVAIGLDEPQGSLAMLVVGERNGGDYQTLIRFPMPFDVIGVGGVIDKAELVLSKRECVIDDPGPVEVQIRTVTRAWEENESIWDRKPTSAGPLVDFTVPAPEARGYFRVDVTDIVREWYSSGTENHGFMLADRFDGKTRRCVFWSREAGPYPLNQPPLLEINHSGGVTPTLIPTPSPTASDTPTPTITPTPSITPTPTDTPPITDTPTATPTRRPQPVFLPFLLDKEDFANPSTPAPTPEVTSTSTAEATATWTPDPGGTPTPDVLIDVNEVNSSGISGEAALQQVGDDVEVILALTGAIGASHASHVHDGTCADLQGILYPLADVIDGHGETTLPAVELADVADGSNAIAAHADGGAVIACGDLPMYP